MKDFRDTLLTKTRPPRFCPACEMGLYLTRKIDLKGLGEQPLEFGCYLKCELCNIEDIWINENFAQEITDSFGMEGAREFVGKFGWFGEKEKLFLSQEPDRQLELFNFEEDII
ncbi:hypothetical protein LEP1GSC188_3369 [Leptospira weilii serovar Topaz str. LT2116]|uniref:Uncharacterized protein n=1 Tax=Leptospira weilii serovar Topaz str. LT2116 TaxID=1088540 RepID=M3G889_9LEPT|nr:hypothetical protein LEP1GSC188_3369 [Leptospira weilii serovar Topaz str. LT2116]